MNRTRMYVVLLIATTASWGFAARASDEVLPSAAETSPPVQSPVHYADGIYVQGSALVVESEHGARTQELGEGWVVHHALPGRGLALVRRSELQMQLRILDADGSEIGRRAFPIDRAIVVSESAIISSPIRSHNSLTAHELRFFSASGTPLAEVRQPDLALVSRSIAAGGYVVTVSEGPRRGQQTVLIYRSDGVEHWRHVFSLQDRTQQVTATITPDGTRIISIQRISLIPASAEVGVYDVAGTLLSMRELGGVSQAVISPDAKSIALVGTTRAAMLLAADGELLWQVPLALEYFSEESVRFSPSGDELLLVSARFDRQKHLATQFLWRIRSDDGVSQRMTIGERGMERRFDVMDIAFDGDEPTRIIMSDGVLSLPETGGGTP